MDNSRILSLDNREQISRQSMDFVTRPHLNLIYETMTSDLAVCGTAACVVVRSVHKKKQNKNLGGHETPYRIALNLKSIFLSKTCKK